MEKSQQLTRGKGNHVTLTSSDGNPSQPETCFASETKVPNSYVLNISKRNLSLSFTVKIGNKSVTKVGKCPIHKGERPSKPTQGGGDEIFWKSIIFP